MGKIHKKRIYEFCYGIMYPDGFFDKTTIKMNYYEVNSSIEQRKDGKYEITKIEIYKKIK